MVNERSPAMAPLRPVVANEQPPAQKSVNSVLSKPTQSIPPQFGKPSVPQSPLNRPAQKESNVFIQPKSRPEHHRDYSKPGIMPINLPIELLSCYLANPNLQSSKDPARLFPPSTYQAFNGYRYITVCAHEMTTVS